MATTLRPSSYYYYDANGTLCDAFSYGYHVVDIDPGAEVDDRKLRNRLYNVRDEAPDAAVPDVGDYQQQLTSTAARYNGITINTANNYSYDALGNLIQDKLEHIAHIDWTVIGKVRGVERSTASGAQRLTFGYGAGGQRIMKTAMDENGNPTVRTHYVRDAQGNVMATYKYRAASGSLKVEERPIYGSSRLGVDAHAQELGGLGFEDPNPYLLDNPIGKVNYELTDHLGNVTTVVTDELIGVNVGGTSAPEYFQPFIVSAQGYEPFGGGLPGRVWDRKQGAPTLRLLRMLESGEDVELDLNAPPKCWPRTTRAIQSLPSTWTISSLRSPP